jgi:hypothetical protein
VAVGADTSTRHAGHRGSVDGRRAHLTVRSRLRADVQADRVLAGTRTRHPREPSAGLRFSYRAIDPRLAVLVPAVNLEHCRDRQRSAAVVNLLDLRRPSAIPFIRDRSDAIDQYRAS